MILTDVPTPGQLTNSIQLRKEVVKALSYVQIQRLQSPSSTGSATLAEFFRACADLADPDAPKPKKGTAK
jgi:hypothetical protein